MPTPNALVDLRAIYAADPMTAQVTCPAPGRKAPAHGGPWPRTAHGFVFTERVLVQGGAAGGYGESLTQVHASTTLRVVAGSLGRPPLDTVVRVADPVRGTRDYRLAASLEPDGDGAEEVAQLVEVTR